MKMKKALALILAFAMIMSTMGTVVFANEAEEIVVNSLIEITEDTTYSNKKFVRGDEYTGGFFSVTGGTLTLENCVVDAGAEWSLKEGIIDKWYDEIENGGAATDIILDTIELNEGNVNTTETLIIVGGSANLVLNGTTIENMYSSADKVRAINISSDETNEVTLTDTVIRNIAVQGQSTVLSASSAGSDVITFDGNTQIYNTIGTDPGAIIAIGGGSLDDENYNVGGSTLYINENTEIYDNIGLDGSLIMVRRGYATMNGGKIYNNHCFYTRHNNSLSPVYIHDGTDFDMTGGEISGNYGYGASSIILREKSAAEIDGGEIGAGVESGYAPYSLMANAGLIIGENTSVAGGVYITADASLENSGVINGDVFSAGPVNNEGTVNGSVTLYGDNAEISNNGVVNDILIGSQTGVESVVATVNGKPYSSIANAISAATDGDIIVLTSDVTSSDIVKLEKNITLDLNGYTLTTTNGYGGMWLKNGASLINGTMVHTGNTAAIKLWNATKISGVDIEVAYTENKIKGGIVIQSSTTSRVDVIENVNIYGDGLTNGIETYNCGDAAQDVIGSMENVTIDANGTGMLISAPCGTATNCDIKGGKTGIEIWIKGTYSATLDLVDCDVEGGTQAVYSHDEFGTGVTNSGILELTVDDNTTFSGDALLTVVNQHDSAFTVSDAVTKEAVAVVNGRYFDTLAKALTAANDGETVELIWAEGDAPIVMSSAVYGNKTITITGSADVDWSKGNLFIGRGGEGNGTVIFDNANLKSVSNQASTGIHVSGREKETDNKYDGTLIIKNSTIDLDYLINKGNITLDNSTFTVKNGFSIGGRPASETESGVDATATITLNNGSKVVVNNHNGMGLGYEAIGVMNIDNTSTFECTKNFLITNRGTMNVNGGNVDVAGKLEVKGTLKSNGNVFGNIEAADTAVIELTGGLYDHDVSEWCAEGYRTTITGLGYYVVNPTTVTTDAISIVYREDEAKRTEEAKVYDIIVKAESGDAINELASVDLSFVYAPTAVGDGNITFTVLPADKFTMTKHEDAVKYPERYMFNYNGVDAVEGSGNELVVGAITVEGFGSYKISTAEVETNIVNATTVNDNLVDSYTAAGATDGDATTGELIINPDVEGKVDDAITVPVRELAINITFPNTVVNNEVIYQDMTVTIVGGNYTEEISLGTDGEGYSFTRELPYNTTYMVTVEGAGYRTARYAVTLNDDKTLNFWNNVMDNALEVEEDKASSATTKNFLAGDIVKDNNINIYDLSAVVAYFGTEGLSKDYKPEYAKYDLNRDGVIDSKDVAYVLVSWGN